MSMSYSARKLAVFQRHICSGHGVICKHGPAKKTTPGASMLYACMHVHSIRSAPGKGIWLIES